MEQSNNSECAAVKESHENQEEEIQQQQPTTSDYINDFDAIMYLNEYYGSPDGHNGDGSPLAFVLDALNRIRCEFLVSLPMTLNERTLLEVGCGPTIHTVMSLSDVYDALYFTDLNDQSRNEVLRWWKRQPGEFCWENTFHYVAKLENCGESSDLNGNDVLYPCSSTAKSIEQRVRSCIHAVLPGDVSQPNVVQNLPCPKVDCIVSSLCLEATSHDLQQYNKSLRALSNLLKPNGKLILIGILGHDHYELGDKRFHLLKLDEMDIRCALRYATLSVPMWFRQDAQTGETVMRDFGQFRLCEDDGSDEECLEDMFVLVAEKAGG